MTDIPTSVDFSAWIRNSVVTSSREQRRDQRPAEQPGGVRGEAGPQISRSKATWSTTMSTPPRPQPRVFPTPTHGQQRTRYVKQPYSESLPHHQ